MVLHFSTGGASVISTGRFTRSPISLYGEDFSTKFLQSVSCVWATNYFYINVVSFLLEAGKNLSRVLTIDSIDNVIG